MAIAGLILGIISIILVWFPVVDYLALVLSIVGIVCSAKGMKLQQSHGMAVAGLVICIVALCLSVPLILCTGCTLCTAGSVAAAGASSSIH
ncbi:MAG: hypothetical protein LKI25_07150 [Atopobiaceae bacterium]|jgi:hypothetical protein|nr:hypothetical protein [Atopobiaceae bacterium]MCI2173964.1 hypothetical protein [Atopobiaceae bacterium]MCI2207946.1 hypothetical protein [Atopobiaceae bacterium]